MPSLSVHQQKKARSKHKLQQRRQGKAEATAASSAAAPHPAALAAEQWLAAHPAEPAAIDPLLSSALFDASYIEAARAAYRSAAPFPHFTLRPLLDDRFCRHLLAICQLLHFTHRRSGQSHTHQPALHSAARRLVGSEPAVLPDGVTDWLIDEQLAAG